MYGGNGVWPCASRYGTTSRSSSISTSSPARATTRARAAPGSSISPPGCGLWLARRCTSARRGAEHALEQQLDAPAGRLAPEHARRQHARVVEDEQVAGAQQLRQVGEHADRRWRPLRRRARASGSRAVRERHLRDQLRRQARSGNRCAASGRDSSGPVAPTPGFLAHCAPAAREPPSFMGSSVQLPWRRRDGGIGRRAGLKIRFWRQSVGSSPSPGTTATKHAVRRAYP